VKYFYYSCFGILIISLSAAAAFSFFAPSYIQKKIEAGILESCSTCSIQIGNTSISLFSPRLWMLHDIHFKEGNPETSSYDVHIDEIAAEVDLRRLWDHHLHFTRLNIANPNLTLIDGEKHSKRSNKESTIKYKLENIRATNGIFTYVRNYKGTHAVLHMAKVEAKTAIFGNEDDLAGKPLDINSSLVMEQSGSIGVDIHTYMFAEGPLKADTIVRIKDQDLGKLTSFFRPNAGVILEGKMLSGLGIAKVRDATLDATVTTTFTGLKIVLEKEVERSSIEAFFENIGLTIDANKENLNKPREDRTRKVTLAREPEERVVSFTLRGLKEAALKVARAD
jgi:hypothetical protein